MKVDDQSLASWLVSGAVVLGLLYYGRELLVPLAFALMLWAVLNALTRELRRMRLPAAVAWVFAFALIGAALYFVAIVIVNEAAAISAQVPVYSTKLQALWHKVPFRTYVPVLDVPTLVQQYNLPGVVGQMAASIGGTVLEIILIAIYVGFLLAEQRHLPGKLVRLQANAQARGETANVIRAVGFQIQSYIGVCTLLSVLMASITYGVLALLHIDFAGFWALVMFLVTYIPTVGAVVVVLPALAALAQTGDPGIAVLIALVLSAVHFLLTNVLSTILLGRSLNLSSLVIILSLTFWGLLWGVAGLFLAVPMTGAVAIACRHLEGLEWVSELLAGPPPRQWRVAKIRL
ncbi:MAG: AI-2E family transporter [Alphaproteobacteria bacterium]|nr:AI-2E family transporter [Alphaproteobacteria bacterium]